MADTDSKRGKKGASDVYLIVDHRERAVVPFIETELKDHAYVLKQINTGDYLVCRKGPGDAAPKILACIERKTHEDFGASFKDGRYENLQKMLALRRTTGCQLYFFLEGPAFPSPSRRFARIPYGNILAAVTKMMVTEAVLMERTENEHHTAQRLADFLAAFDAHTPYVFPVEAAAEGGAPSDDNAAPGGELAVPEVLTRRLDQTDDQAAVTMWARLRGVSVVLGKILTREFSVADLATQKVGVDRLRVLKTATGRTINKDALASLMSVRAGSLEHAVKLVSGLRNVTPAVARLILDSSGGLARLCGYSAGAMSIIAIPQKNRTVKLGETRAERIRRLLHYTDTGHRLDGEQPAVAEPTGNVLGGRAKGAVRRQKGAPAPAPAAQAPSRPEAKAIARFTLEDFLDPSEPRATSSAPEGVGDGELDEDADEGGTDSGEASCEDDTVAFEAATLTADELSAFLAEYGVGADEPPERKAEPVALKGPKT